MNGITAVLTNPAGLFVSLGFIGLLVISGMYLAAAYWLRRTRAPLSWQQRHRSARRQQAVRLPAPRLSQRITTVTVSSARPSVEPSWTMPRRLPYSEIAAVSAGTSASSATS